MKHILKHGASVPTTKDLDDRQLGICTSNNILYTRIGDKIVALNDFSNEPLLPHEFRTVHAQYLYDEQRIELSVETKSGLKKTFTATCAYSTKSFNLRYGDDDNYTAYPVLNGCSHNNYNHTFYCNETTGIGQFIIFFSPEESYKITVLFDDAFKRIIISIGYIDATIGNN